MTLEPAPAPGFEKMSALPPKADKREKARTLAVQIAMSDLDQNRAGRECAVRQLVLFSAAAPVTIAILCHGTLQCALERSIESTRNFGNLFVVKLAEQRRRFVVLES